MGMGRGMDRKVKPLLQPPAAFAPVFHFQHDAVGVVSARADQHARFLLGEAEDGVRKDGFPAREVPCEAVGEGVDG